MADEKQCPHGYGIKQGPCGICDSGDDLLSKRALLYKFAEFLVNEELTIDYNAYGKKYDLIYIDHSKFSMWLLDAFERSETNGK